MDERQLGIEITAIDEATRSVVDNYLKPRKKLDFSSGIPIGGPTALAMHALEEGVEAVRSRLERRRLHSLTGRAPEALDPLEHIEAKNNAIVENESPSSGG